MPRRVRLPRKWAFSSTSFYGLIATSTYQGLLLVVWTLQSWSHVSPRGFRVHVLRPEVRTQLSPGIQPILVELESAGALERPRVYINSQLVSWEQFGPVLQKELAVRPPDWRVYLKGDRGMDWGAAVEAIDEIRGQHAEVVLLTKAQP